MEPSKNHHKTQTFIEAVNNDADKTFLEKKKLPINNLSNSDKKAIEYFSKLDDLIITKQVKEGRL